MSESHLLGPAARKINNRVAPEAQKQEQPPAAFCVRDMDASSTNLQLFESMFGQLVQNMTNEFWTGKKTLMQVDHIVSCQ